MKKPLILMLAVAGSVMSASALAKVSYADALESNRPAKEARVYTYPDSEGLGPHEIPDADSGGEGVWASTTYNANYSYFGLAGVSNSGNACAEVGVRAYETYRECDGREGVCWDAHRYFVCQ